MANLERKILDIVPPEKQSGFSGESVVTGLLTKNRKPGLFILIIALVAAFVSILSYFSLLRVVITIQPKYEKVVKSNDVYFDANLKAADYANRRMPVIAVNISKDYVGTFVPKTSVNKEVKASGIIKIYNATPSAQVLVKDTRFLSADGKLFRLTNRITVPASTTSGGKVLPGTIDSEVIAAEGGDSYNIGATTFSVPGFAGTAKYTSFYAKSFSPMTGGYTGQIGEISESDLSMARTAVVEELTRLGDSAIEARLAEGLIMIDDLKNVSYKDVKYSANLGELTNSFTASGTIDIGFLAFQKDDFEELVETMVGINEGALESPFGIDGGKLVRKNSISIEANLENSDPKSQKGVLHLTVSGETYQDIKKDIVKNMIKGKSFSEAKQLLESQSSIDIVRVNAKPFIVGSKITNDPSKIEIEIVQ